MTAKPWDRWVTGIGLLLLGGLSPVVVLAGTCVTLVAGPLALLAAPVLGILLTRMLCGYAYARSSPRWFWFYVGVGTATWSLMVGSMLWSNHPSSGPDEWGGFYSSLGDALLLAGLLATILFWLIGVVWTWLARKRQARA